MTWAFADPFEEDGPKVETNPHISAIAVRDGAIRPKNNLLFAAARPVPENFLPQFRCAQVFLEGDRRRKDRKNPHLPGLALQRDARQQTGDEQAGCGKTCTHRANNSVKKGGGWALAMALDASRIETRSKNRSKNIYLLYHSTVVKCEPFERGRWNQCRLRAWKAQQDRFRLEA